MSDIETIHEFIRLQRAAQVLEIGFALHNKQMVGECLTALKDIIERLEVTLSKPQDTNGNRQSKQSGSQDTIEQDPSEQSGD